MVVIDRNVITRLQTDQSGIDFMELSANLIRAHQLRYTSQHSILDSEGTSKGLSPISLGYSPPSYEDIFGDKQGDLPPSYSELSLLFRQRQLQMSEGNELQSFQRISLVGNQPTVEETVLNISEVIVEQPLSNEVEPDEEKPLGNCKYSVLSLEEDRKAKIKCYCEDTVDNIEEAGCSSNCTSDTKNGQDVNPQEVLSIGKNEDIRESSL